MKNSQPKTPLVQALERFGRQAACLRAAKLESMPDLLVVLFGEDVLGDGELLHARAVEVEQSLLAIVAGIPDLTDRRIAEAVLAANEEFYQQNTTQRLQTLQTANGISTDVFWTRRPVVVREIAAELKNLCGAEAAAGVPLSDQAQRLLAQLYRYAQETAVKLEAFTDVGRLAELGLGADEGEPPSLEDLSSGDRFVDEFFDLLIKMDGPFADMAFWSYAYCHRYLVEASREPSARFFLRENLPTEWWIGLRLDIPFGKQEIVQVLEALSASESDDPAEFVALLCQDDVGEELHERWVTLLTSKQRLPEYGEPARYKLPAVENRTYLTGALTELCRVLQVRFPEQTMSREAAMTDYSACLLSRAMNVSMEGASIGERYLDYEADSVDWGRMAESEG